MSGRPTQATVERWADEVEAVAERVGPRFARSEPRRRAVGYIRGLLSDTQRKNGWQLAEHLGEGTPDGVQHLLARADWDADAVPMGGQPRVGDRPAGADRTLGRVGVGDAGPPPPSTRPRAAAPGRGPALVRRRGRPRGDRPVCGQRPGYRIVRPVAGPGGRTIPALEVGRGERVRGDSRTHPPRPPATNCPVPDATQAAAGGGAADSGRRKGTASHGSPDLR